MALHATSTSLFDKDVKMKPRKKLRLKSTIKCFNEVKIDKGRIYLTHFSA